MINPAEAANIFIDILYRRIYQEISSYMEKDIIPKGLPGRADDPAELEKWYHTLSADDKAHIIEIVKIVIKETVLSILVILDNNAGSPIVNTNSEFALFLQSFEERKTYPEDPIMSVRLNLSNSKDNPIILEHLLSDRFQLHDEEV